MVLELFKWLSSAAWVACNPACMPLLDLPDSKGWGLANAQASFLRGY
jgi:hypothetical protein